MGSLPPDRMVEMYQAHEFFPGSVLKVKKRSLRGGGGDEFFPFDAVEAQEVPEDARFREAKDLLPSLHPHPGVPNERCDLLQCQARGDPGGLSAPSSWPCNFD